MKVIVPCCGRSSRFPNQPPKWMLPAYDGRPMICLAVSQLNFSLDDLVVTILQDHEDQFQVTAGLKAAFGRSIRTCILKIPTRSQSETVALTLQQLAINEPFLIKDSDNTFAVDEVLREENYICADSLNNYDSINPRNKSYLQVSRNSLITNIREKVVISDTFNVGGYFFTSPEQFLSYYARLSADKADWNRELYLSDVIGSMILDGVPFHAKYISGYHDWGTVVEWRRAMLDRKTYFVSLDGFLFERGSEYFKPRFADVVCHPHAADAVRSLVGAGHQLIYLSIRSSALRDLTLQQLRENNLPEAPMVFECPIAKWTLVTAPHATMPFHTCSALELSPDHPNLVDSLAGEISAEQ